MNLLRKTSQIKEKFVKRITTFKNRESKNPSKKFTFETMKIDFEWSLGGKKINLLKPAIREHIYILMKLGSQQSRTMRYESKKIKDESVKAFNLKEFDWKTSMKNKNWMEEAYIEVLKMILSED